jgi:uncharacterized protein (DUF1810 family)
MNDSFQLDRFVTAQKRDFERALTEIRGGQKRSHWMWYIFPQFAGLGFGPTSQHYAVKSLDEARAYLRHQVLGPRLIECAEAALRVQDKSATDVFGTSDDLKLRSSATLFASISPADSVFHRLLDKYFDGDGDEKTLRLIDEG